MGNIHEFFYDNKWLGILVVLAGLTYSGFLYFRAYEQWIGAKRQDRGRRLRHHLHQHAPSSETGKLIKPPSAATPGTTEEGQQEDLLSRLAREDEDSDFGELPTEVGSERSTRSNLKPDPAYRSTHILKAFDDFADESEDEETGGGTATAKTGTERTPLQNAIRAAVEESLRDEVTPEAPTEDLERDDRGSDPLISGTTAPPQPPAERKRSSTSHTEAHRRAQRHEDMGLHREVHADEITDKGVRRISDDDRKRRLSQLGIAFDNDTFETEAQRRARLGTDELDDILGRLDAALATPAPGASPAVPSSTAAPEASPAAPTPDPHAPTLHMEQQAPPTLDAHAPTVIGGAGTAAAADSQPAGESSAEDDDDLVLRDQSGTTEDELLGAVDAQQAEDAAEEPDQGDDDDPIPDWARADSFDDDEPQSGGEHQQKLF